MRIHYNLSGAARKALVTAISEELNLPAHYQGAPTFAYEVGGYHIDKAGMLDGADNHGLVADLLGLHDFKAEQVEFDTMLQSADATPDDVSIPETAALGGRVNPYHDEQEPPAYAQPESDAMAIEVPLEGFTEESLVNLEKLVASKASLIQKAICTDALPILRTETTLQFPWFQFGLEGEAVNAYTQFIGALCAAAKLHKHVTAKEKPVENEKFAFRVFLIRLGFVGQEYRVARKILLKNLAGNSAFKNGAPSKQGVAVDE